MLCQPVVAVVEGQLTICMGREEQNQAKREKMRLTPASPAVTAFRTSEPDRPRMTTLVTRESTTWPKTLFGTVYPT